MRSQNYRLDIQVFRGIAVIAVLLFHAREGLFPHGYLGVDVFFVISGFVVTPLFDRILTDQSDGRNLASNLGAFYKRRFFRLAPALGAMLGVSACVIFFAGDFADLERFAKQGIATILLLGNWGANAYNGDYFSPNPNPLIHTWSLSVEEQIYLILPILLIVLLRNRAKVEKNIPRVFVVLILISLSLYLGTYGEGVLQFAFYSPFTRVWEFCLGGIAFYVSKKWERLRVNLTPVLHVILIAIIASILFAPFSFDARVGSLLTCLATFGVIIFRTLNHIPQIFVNALVWVGDRSYSIYLVHMPILYVLLYSSVFPSGPTFKFREVAALLLSICLGALSFSKVEQKYRIRADKKVVSDMPRVFAKFAVFPLALFLVILVSNSTISGLDGIPRPAKIAGWAWDSKCIYYGGAATIFPPCAYLVPDAKGSVLLIDDSHAASASMGVVEAANGLNLNVYISTHAGCPYFFLTKAEAKNLKIVYSKLCLVHNHEMNQWIAQNNPLAVIYTIRSSSLIPNDLEMNRQSYNSFLATNFRRLHRLVPNLIQVGPVPEFQAPLTLMGHFLNPHLDVAPEPGLDNQFWKDQSKATGVLYIDAISIFCASGHCKNKDGSEWLYEDRDHLSISGSRLLEPALRSALLKIS